jgi:hypothetical protein
MAAASATPLLDAMGLKPGAGFLEKLREAVDMGTLDFYSLCIPLILEIRYYKSPSHPVQCNVQCCAVLSV